MRSRFSFPSSKSEDDASRYVALLAQQLQDFFVTVNGLHLIVRVGVFRLANTAFHPFKAVSSAEFRVVPASDCVVVECDVRLTGLAWTLGAFGVVVSVWSGSRWPTLWDAFGPLVGVALVFILNCAWTHFSVRRFLRRIADKVAQPMRSAGGKVA
jgi:hypothetical protein